jgi:hypothetical protein
MKDQPKPGGSALQPFLMAVVAFAFIIYLIGALNTGNWLWVLPIQPHYEPSRIVVRDRGQSVEYRPGIDGFIELSTAIDTALADFANLELIPIGLSEETLQEYNESAVVMEIYYPQDIRFNTISRMSNVNQLMIPIQGRHADLRYVFLGSDGRWLTGALVMDNDQPVRDVMRDLGHIE